MKVLIVGAGIGGLTLAHVFEKGGIEYQIVERSHNGDPERQGFIIGLWSSGRRILQKIGLSEAFDEKSTPTHEATFARGNGQVIKRINYRPLESRDGAGLACIKRADLYAILSRGIPQGNIHYETTPTAIEQKGDVVSVTFSDGSTNAYDFVVGADGAKSWVRQQIFSDAIITYTNWRVWCTWVPKKFETRNTISAYVEAKELGVVVHTRDAAMAWLVTPTDHTSWDTEEGRVERLTKYFQDITVFIPDALAHAKDNEIPVSDFMEVSMKHLVRGRVALVGDAAHCLGPYTGFSSSMAMEDAYVLGESLILAQEGKLSIQKALERYETLRVPRIEILRAINNGIRSLVLSDSKLARACCNGIIRILPAAFIRSLAGIMTRWNIA
ncbi:MAG: FAD-dependent urate hydroxylase [Candidatus Parcubacteria bacterium]|jgi:FAD-dependent urate hydroxylase